MWNEVSSGRSARRAQRRQTNPRGPSVATCIRSGENSARNRSTLPSWGRDRRMAGYGGKATEGILSSRAAPSRVGDGYLGATTTTWCPDSVMAWTIRRSTVVTPFTCGVNVSEHSAILTPQDLSSHVKLPLRRCLSLVTRWATLCTDRIQENRLASILEFLRNCILVIVVDLVEGHYDTGENVQDVSPYTLVIACAQHNCRRSVGVVGTTRSPDH